MFKKIQAKKQQLIRYLFGTFTATSLMFVFQACYGMPSNDDLMLCVQGQVISETTGEPIPNIEVQCNNSKALTYTNEEGYFDIDVPWSSVPDLTFRDIDQAANGQYATKDTVLDHYANDFVIIPMKSIRHE